MICPECGHDNRAGVLICERCGSDFYDTLLGAISTKQLDRIDTRELAADGNPVTSHPIVLYVTHHDQPIAVERRADVTLGRNEADVEVNVNLDPYDGKDKGVSRRHAILNAAINPPTLVDLDSYNGTFINGVKLIPQQPYPLNSGDEIRLGRLALRFYYK